MIVSEDDVWQCSTCNTFNSCATSGPCKNGCRPKSGDSKFKKVEPEYKYSLSNGLPVEEVPLTLQIIIVILVIVLLTGSIILFK